MTDDLDNKTDRELNEIFAEEVAGWTPHRGLMHTEFSRGSEWLTDAPRFCTDANAVLPWLGNHHWRGNSNGCSGSNSDRYPHYTIFVTERPVAECPERFGREHCGDSFVGDLIAPSFARAAVIALIRAKRAEKGNP